MTPEPLLRTRELFRRFGGHLAVDAVSLELMQGEVYCIIGPNGAGKTTLLNMLCGTLAPTSGAILFKGIDMVGRPRRDIARAGIARKFQVPTVFGSLTVRQNIELAANGPAARQPVGVDDILESVELGPVAHQNAGHLAHGKKQWLEIAMAMATSPLLLLLDEPTAGMTPDETAKTAALIRSLRGRVTVLAIEHDMSFVRALASETIAMHQGRVIASGAFETVAADDTVRAVYLGKD